MKVQPYGVPVAPVLGKPVAGSHVRELWEQHRREELARAQGLDELESATSQLSTKLRSRPSRRQSAQPGRTRVAHDFSWGPSIAPVLVVRPIFTHLPRSSMSTCIA